MTGAMVRKIFADTIVVIHFGWILFMLFGFLLTAYGSFTVYILRTRKDSWERFFDRWIFRTVHVCGILYVALLAVLREYCPLTIWENALRSYDPEAQYPGSFLVHHIEKLVYPDVHPMLIVIPTVIIAVFTLGMFVVRPPAKIKEVWNRFSH